MSSIRREGNETRWHTLTLSFTIDITGGPVSPAHDLADRRHRLSCLHPPLFPPSHTEPQAHSHKSILYKTLESAPE